MGKGLVKLERIYHEGKRHIKLEMNRDDTMAEAVKNIPNCHWDEEQNCYIVENDEQALATIFRAFHRKAWVKVDGLF